MEKARNKSKKQKTVDGNKINCVMLFIFYFHFLYILSLFRYNLKNEEENK